jgi:hypothetical protein
MKVLCETEQKRVFDIAREEAWLHTQRDRHAAGM